MAARQAWGGGNTAGGLSKSCTLPRSMGSKATSNTAAILTNRPKVTAAPQALNKKGPAAASVVPGGIKRTTGPGQTQGVGSKPATERSKLPNSIRSCDTKLAQLILDEIIEAGSPVTWEDVSGQEVFLPSIMIILPITDNIKLNLFIFYRLRNKHSKKL